MGYLNCVNRNVVLFKRLEKKRAQNEAETINNYQ